MPARKSATSLGVEGPLRDEAVAAAERAGMSGNEWLERAVRKALEEGLEPSPSEGVEMEELEAMVRRVVAEELRPVREALAQPESTATVPSSSSMGSPVSFMRERMRSRRSR